jgi:hypothetical protein
MVESDYCSIDKSIGRSFISKSFDSDAIMISVTKPIKNLRKTSFECFHNDLKIPLPIGLVKRDVYSSLETD